MEGKLTIIHKNMQQKENECYFCKKATAKKARISEDTDESILAPVCEDCQMDLMEKQS
jgi:hypothetical protein